MSNNKKSKWQQRREVKQHTARVVKQHLEGREVLQRQLTKLIEEGTTPAPTTRMTKHTVNVTLDAYRTYLEKPSEENYLRFENFKKISDGMLSDEAKQKLNALLLSHQIRFNDKVSVQDNAIRMRCAMKDNLGTQITKLISDYPEIQASIKIQKLINDSTQTLRQSLRHSGKRPSAQDYQKTRDAINSAMRVYRVDIESMNRMNKYLDEFHGSIRAESAAKKAINKNITYFPGEKAVAFKSVSDANDFRQDRQKIANMSGLSNAEITVNVKADKTIRPKAKPKSKTEKVESTIPRKRTVKEAITKSKPIKAAKRVVAKATKPNVKLEKQKEARKPRKTARKSTGIFAMSPDENNRKRFDTQAAPTIQAPAAPPNRTNKPSISANSNIEKAITNANDIMVSTIRMEREARKLPAQEKIEKIKFGVEEI